MFFFFYKKAKGEVIKSKRTPVRLEILNHITNYLNISINKEVNFKARNIFIVDNQFVWNNIFLPTSRKHTNPICGKVVSWYGLSNNCFEFFLTFILVQCQLSLIILCTPPRLLNAFTNNLRVEICVAVNNYMVSMLSHLESICLK